jgi:hypothetical protein
VDCIYEGDRMMYIHPVNADFFADLGSPGGASAVGKIRKDHPIVAGLPPAAIRRAEPAAVNR